MFQKTRETLILSFLALALTVPLHGCSGNCESLAEKICSCRPNRTEENTCLEQIKAGSGLEVTTEQEQICSELLDTCTCDALERDDLAACGLAPRASGS